MSRSRFWKVNRREEFFDRSMIVARCALLLYWCRMAADSEMLCMMPLPLGSCWTGGVLLNISLMDPWIKTEMRKLLSSECVHDPGSARFTGLVDIPSYYPKTPKVFQQRPYLLTLAQCQRLQYWEGRHLGLPPRSMLQNRMLPQLSASIVTLDLSR